MEPTWHAPAAGDGRKACLPMVKLPSPRCRPSAQRLQLVVPPAPSAPSVPSVPSASVHRTLPLSTELIHCAQNSSDVHGTSVVHRTHPLCTELVRTVHGTRPLCTELIRCARNSSVLHRTNDCCAQNSLEPTFAVHQPACSPLCTVRCRRTPCPGCSGPTGPARTLAHCACTTVHSP